MQAATHLISSALLQGMLNDEVDQFATTVGLPNPRQQAFLKW
jgi:hypothetical protein